MTAAVKGGAVRRYVRQWVATMVLGLLLTGVILFRLSFVSPLLALALLVGLFSMSAVACCLGKLTNTAKTFMSLYLFGLYVATQAQDVAVLDVFGFNGVATLHTILLQMLIGVGAVCIAYFYTMYKHR
jgi:hypothetical protein